MIPPPPDGSQQATRHLTNYFLTETDKQKEGSFLSQVEFRKGSGGDETREEVGNGKRAHVSSAVDLTLSIQ